MVYIVFWDLGPTRATCTSQADVLYVQERTPTGVLEGENDKVVIYVGRRRVCPQSVVVSQVQHGDSLESPQTTKAPTAANATYGEEIIMHESSGNARHHLTDPGVSSGKQISRRAHARQWEVSPRSGRSNG